MSLLTIVYMDLHRIEINWLTDPYAKKIKTKTKTNKQTKNKTKQNKKQTNNQTYIGVTRLRPDPGHFFFREKWKKEVIKSHDSGGVPRKLRIYEIEARNFSTCMMVYFVIYNIFTCRSIGRLIHSFWISEGNFWNIFDLFPAPPPSFSGLKKVLAL